VDSLRALGQFSVQGNLNSPLVCDIECPIELRWNNAYTCDFRRLELKGVPRSPKSQGMPLLPHNFPTLRKAGNPDHRPSILLLGAGMSYGLVPGPGQLLDEKRATAEASLGFASTLTREPSPPPDLLYQWADEVIAELDARGDPIPKLTLAHSLDIPYEDYWMAYVSVRRSAARHRVVARFAREGLWDEIWSLNWDCVQENALENVGIIRDGTKGVMPWPTVFRSFITAADCARIGESHSVRIIKPHGCVMALVDAEKDESSGLHTEAVRRAQRFLITATELTNLTPAAVPVDPTQTVIFARLCEKLCSLPFVIAGWRASEQYLLDYIDNTVRPTLDIRSPLGDDELSIVDMAFNDQGHTRLAGFYGKNEQAAHIAVDKHGFDTDQFFLWLQALYALGSLDQWAPEADRATLAEITTCIEQPPNDPYFVKEWVDSFLPVWVRLCWRCGLITCYSEGQLIASDDINLESRDEHIPWRLPAIQRLELTGAVRLLTALHRSGNGGTWDFETFPGGLYKSNLLVIPIPAWDKPRSNDLRGLKALIDALKGPGAGYVSELRVVFLSPDTGEIPEERKRILKELVARDLAMIRFAKGSDIEEIGLGDL
jgi:hypothetical protein